MTKGKVGAVSPDKINHCIRTINTAIEDAKQYTDSSNETVKAFGEDGGNKAAIRLVAKLRRMETAVAQEFLRAVEVYAEAAGIYDQIDLLDPMPKVSGQGVVAH